MRLTTFKPAAFTQNLVKFANSFDDKINFQSKISNTICEKKIFEKKNTTHKHNIFSSGKITSFNRASAH